MSYNPNWSVGGPDAFSTFTGTIDVTGAVTHQIITNPFTKSRIVGCILHTPSKSFAASAAQLSLGTTTPVGADLAAASLITSLVNPADLKTMAIILDQIRTEASIYLNMVAYDAGPSGVVYYSVTFAKMD